ncbi:MAG: cytochrome oxidase [Deltaproteobacteria bacterium]|nr:cytochrome oxidase [Deltaproteobacteria bacterium]
MNALTLTLFVSALLLLYGLVQFVAAWLRRDHEHADRLALLPLLDDEGPATAPPGETPQ